MLSDEEGKAIQEIAKTTGEGIKATREMGAFIAQYIGGPLEQAMGIWEDKLKYRRWENQIALAEKAKSLLVERGLNGPTRLLSLDIAIPLLEEASLADVKFLRDRWAMLMANAADADAPPLRRAYISILSEITSQEAVMLDKLFDADAQFVPNTEERVATIATSGLPYTAAPGHDKPSSPLGKDIEVGLVNLARLGLIDSAAAWGGISSMHWVYMTELGRQFVGACRLPVKEWFPGEAPVAD